MRVLRYGKLQYRDLPWRRTSDPYEVLVSEVMLQQTQVKRVDGRWQSWLERFPTLDALACASSAEVLQEWQGLGYNRRALSLWKACQQMSHNGGVVPSELSELVRLPGIGPATAAGVRAFAFNLPGIYLETNVRTVFLHELFPQAEDVPDSALVPLVEECCPPNNTNPEDDPKTWYWALLDYGAYLKQVLPNPSRRSRSYAKQSRFEGSRRQKRAELVRILLAEQQTGHSPCSEDLLCEQLSESETRAGREPVSLAFTRELLEELAREGFCHDIDGMWSI
ncbi:MAG: adenine glycosylase [Atopobiaceae bacterium]|nr:adenine glycosylase [Atopobiaceae bacterium]